MIINNKTALPVMYLLTIGRYFAFMLSLRYCPGGEEGKYLK